MKDFATVSRPLSNMLRKTQESRWRAGLVWTEAELAAFEGIKCAIAEVVMLSHPCMTEPFLVVCDASGYGCGAMLAQLGDDGREVPVAFASKLFCPAQCNYSATQREALAVVWAMEHFRPYVHGVPTVVVTDHVALTWLINVNEPTARMSRWVAALQDYDVTVIHRAGARNQIADALSRLQRRMDGTEAKDTDDDGPTPVFVVAMITRRKAAEQLMLAADDVDVKSGDVDVRESINPEGSEVARDSFGGRARCAISRPGGWRGKS